MGRHALVIGLLASCSWSMGTPAKPTSAQVERVCERRAPLVDTIAGASFIGLAAGAGLLAVETEAESAAFTAAAIASAVGGTLFLLSAHHGYDAQATCVREELIAARKDSTPLHLHVERSHRTCVQRRLDMYSQAVTGADLVQRAQLLAELPVCDESAARERAWQLTKNAALDAGNGKCEDIESIAQQVHSIDVGLHDVVLLGDVQIKYCLQRREL